MGNGKRRGVRAVWNDTGLARLIRNRKGVVLSEYAFLLVVFGIPVVTGMYAAGTKIVQFYGDVRDHALSSHP